ncbi:hypothetical protein KUCAC02_026644 [Chaenocephalus aceratus]|nr:hypothetical protein KUCAC02_026644 [Chaenocephalus aceratus]
MISRLLKNQEALKAAPAKQKHQLTMLTPAEWHRLQRLQTLLTPCRYVTELLGGETDVSCSVVSPALRHLTRTMEVSGDDPAHVVTCCLPRGERGGVWTSVEEKQNHSRTHRGASKEEELPAEDEEGPNGALGRYRAEPTIRDRLPTAVASCLGNWLKEKKQKK